MWPLTAKSKMSERDPGIGTTPSSTFGTGTIRTSPRDALLVFNVTLWNIHVGKDEFVSEVYIVNRKQSSTHLRKFEIRVGRLIHLQ